MINFLLGISLTINVIIVVFIIIGLNIYLKKSKSFKDTLNSFNIQDVKKPKEDFGIFSSEEVVDKDMFNDFFK